jgi:hypothetical protein
LLRTLSDRVERAQATSLSSTSVTIMSVSRRGPRCRAPSWRRGRRRRRRPCGSAAGKDVVKLKLGEGAVGYGKKAVSAVGNLLRILMPTIARARDAMIEEYAESYQRIADALTPGLPKGWTEVFVLAEMRTSEVMVSGFARTKAPEPEWFEVPMPAYDAFRAMYVVARDSGDPKVLWTSATLHLKNDGTFQVDYAYDPVPVEDQFDRIAAWAQSHGAGSP